MRTALTGLILMGLSMTAQADPLAEWKKADAQAQEAWQNLPLMVQNVLFAAEEPTGYGMYKPRQSNVFKPTDTLFTYAELLGHKWKPLPDGLNELAIVADAILKDTAGNIVLEKKNFFQSSVVSYKSGREFLLNSELTITDAPEGDYILTYDFRINGKSITFDQPFTIRESR